MLSKVSNWWAMFTNYRLMMKGVKFFDKNPVVQGRFEENEDWLEEIDQELDKLLESHKVIKKRIAEIENLLKDKLKDPS
tara:strand:- start:519 stop:755 length:237 start_codon:yes stop_codon:yes gene_type:complete